MMAEAPSQHEDRLVSSPLVEAHLSRLHAVLEEMVKVHQQFLSLLQREKGLMIDGEVNGLIRCLGEKEGILAQLRQLDRNREREMDLIAKEGAMSPNLTLKDLISGVSEPYRARLQSCHVRLSALSASIVEINGINHLVVERTLQQVTTLVGLIKHLSQPVTTYQSTGLLRDYAVSGKTIGRG